MYNLKMVFRKYKNLYILCFILFSHVRAEIDAPLMSYEEYKTLEINFPYTFVLKSSNQSLFYFGANHSCDPDDRQYNLLDKFWNDFLIETKLKNCVVLVEGCLRNLKNITTKEEAILYAGGEGGFITFLASLNNIIVCCPESDDFLIKELSKFFTAEVIAYKIFAQNMLSLIRKFKGFNKEINHENLMDAISDLLSKLKNHYNKFNFPFSLEEIKGIHASLFNREIDFTDESFFYHITNPVENHSIINRACRQASILRDINIVKFIEKYIKEGKNLFIVYGGTHAIMQEPAIYNLFNKTN